MNYDELYARISTLPNATDGWLRRTISFVDRGRPHSTSYCLVRNSDDDWTVYLADERDEIRLATAADGETPLAFDSESDACEWIWNKITWRDRRKAQKNAQ